MRNPSYVRTGYLLERRPCSEVTYEESKLGYGQRYLSPGTRVWKLPMRNPSIFAIVLIIVAWAFGGYL